MAVYTHFGAMSAVVDEVATEGFRRLIDHVDAVGVTDDPIADLLRSAAAYRDNALENRHLYGVMFGAVSVVASAATEPTPRCRAPRSASWSTASAGRWPPARSATATPRAVAAQFWSALHGYVMLELAGMDQVVEDPEHSCSGRCCRTCCPPCPRRTTRGERSATRAAQANSTATASQRPLRCSKRIATARERRP